MDTAQTDLLQWQVVAGAGAIEHGDLVSLSEKAFANLPTDPTTAAELVAQVCPLIDISKCGPDGSFLCTLAASSLSTLFAYPWKAPSNSARASRLQFQQSYRLTILALSRQSRVLLAATGSCAWRCNLYGKHSSMLQEPSIFTGSDVRVRDPDLQSTSFAVAFKGASWTDPDSIPLMVMQSLLGGWDKSSSSGRLLSSSTKYPSIWYNETY